MYKKINIGIAIFLLALGVWIANPLDLYERLKQFDVAILLPLSFLLVCNLLAAGVRFWRVLHHFGLGLSLRSSLSASMAGNLAGLFFIPLLGQVAGRQLVLQQYGVPSVLNSSLSAYERLVVAISSAFLAIIGAVALFGAAVSLQLLEGFNLVEVILAAGLAGFLNYQFFGRKFEKQLVGKLFNRKNLERLIEVMGLGLIGQLLMLSAFAVCFHVVAPQISWFNLFCTAAIVSFAASMPVSAGGWGVRELAAVFVLGKLGVPASDAVAASVVVGLCSTLVVLIVAPLFAVRYPSAMYRKVVAVPAGTALVQEDFAFWLLGFAVVVGVFFQVHLVLPSGELNVNMADPFALFSLGALALHCLFLREAPAWRIPAMNRFILVVLLILVVGFINGWMRVGITQWALGGKVFGVVVLLGYLSAGYLIVRQFGSHGLYRITQTVVMVALVIVIFQLSIRVGKYVQGIPIQSNFEGFAANRNAFAFQLICAISLLLAHAAWCRKSWYLILGLSALCFGVLLTGSRTAIGVVFVLITLGVVFQKRERYQFLAAALLAGGMYGLVELVPVLTDGFSGGGGHHVSSQFSDKGSDGVRWRANYEALQMWWSSPVWGAGLGVFLVEKEKIFGYPLQIHNSFLWVLAEFGLVGFAAALYGIWLFGRFLWVEKVWCRLAAGRSLALLVLSFLMFSQMHEILYQRMLWLLIGACLAVPHVAKRLKLSPL
ncbi:lysylphosphatidylglycerol synthase domain-containing protein [uncultured Dechloromonas sp.]|uniref:lysylphosphatidylglycerol synthase domain-containing protein n=1 Tax=uncultured Dechloromonas sp. TaxID=171719 RepID=UPI0025DF9449|nr:lysylphosphatidylglycerol synthase domain-containing protein [uncultured Dechloromonas sp.]